MNYVILISNPPLLIINLSAENIHLAERRENLNIRPLWDRIIVKKFEEEAKTACVMYIPERQPRKNLSGEK